MSCNGKGLNSFKEATPRGKRELPCLTERGDFREAHTEVVTPKAKSKLGVLILAENLN